MNHPAFQDLVKAIHAGPLEQPLWSSFVELLRSVLAASSTSFSFNLGKSVAPGVLASSPAPGSPVFGEGPGDGLELVGPPPASEPFVPYRIYRVEEYLDRANPEHDHFYRTVIEPFGNHYLTVIPIPVPSGGDAWFTAARKSTGFTKAEDDLLLALVPHLEISLRTFFALERERSRAIASQEAVRKLDFCWLKLDSDCLIVDLDRNAEDLLQRSQSVTRSPRGQLALARPSANAALKQAMRTLSQDSSDRALALHVGDQPWLDMLLVPARSSSLVDRMKPTAIAYIHGEAGFGHERQAHLMELFNLSTREAGLAIAICRGLSIREAAGQIGLTEQSAREYTKRIYAKTGTRGQADLVRLILTSVVAIA